MMSRPTMTTFPPLHYSRAHGATELCILPLHPAAGTHGLFHSLFHPLANSLFHSFGGFMLMMYVHVCVLCSD